MKKDVIAAYERDLDTFVLDKSRIRRRPARVIKEHVLPNDEFIQTVVKELSNDFDIHPKGTYCNVVLQNSADRWYNRYLRLLYRKRGLMVYVPPGLSALLERRKWGLSLLSKEVQRMHRPMMASVHFQSIYGLDKFLDIFLEWADDRSYMPIVTNLSEYQEYTSILHEWREITP